MSNAPRKHNGLILPASMARTQARYRYWHDVANPGDLARAIVVAKRDGRVPPRTPEHCPNRECQTCRPRRDAQGNMIPPDHR